VSAQICKRNAKLLSVIIGTYVTFYSLIALIGK